MADFVIVLQIYQPAVSLTSATTFSNRFTMRNQRVLVLVVVLASIFLFTALCLFDSRHAWEWIYTHWLYDYQFGFMKRGLIGEILASFYGPNAVVPLATVKVISWALFLANTGLFLFFFNSVRDKISSDDPSAKPAENQNPKYLGYFLFCLLAPTFLRNFSYDLGRFDQISSLVLLLQWWQPAVWITLILSVLMVLIHENYLFIFLPAVLLLVYLQKGLRSSFTVALASLAATLIVVKFGAADTDIETLWQYLLSKADSPLDRNVTLLYWSFSDQLSVNKTIRLGHLQYIPGFIFYLLWCVPLMYWLKRGKPQTDSLAKLGFAGIAVGYVIIFVLSDWCRSTANLFITLTFLIVYFLDRDTGFRERFLSRKSLSHPLLYAVIALSVFIPATGVDIPRIYKFDKLFELLKSYL